MGTMLKAYLRGAESVLNLYPRRRAGWRPSIPTHTDAEAMYEDWLAVGSDLTEAIDQFDHAGRQASENEAPRRG